MINPRRKHLGVAGHELKPLVRYCESQTENYLNTTTGLATDYITVQKETE